RTVPHWRSLRYGPHFFHAGCVAVHSCRRRCSAGSALPSGCCWTVACFAAARLLSFAFMQLSPCSKNFGNAPRLGDAARGGERRIAVEDFTDLADARVAQVRADAVEIGAGLCEIAVHAVVRTYEWAQQPAPHGPLVISPIAFAGTTDVGADISHRVRREAAQPHGRPQMSCASIDY